MDVSVAGQISAIEATFDHIANPDTLKNLTHPTKPGLSAVEIFPVFPDFELWSTTYTHVIYDADPLLKGTHGEKTVREIKFF